MNKQRFGQNQNVGLCNSVGPSEDIDNWVILSRWLGPYLTGPIPWAHLSNHGVLHCLTRFRNAEAAVWLVHLCILSPWSDPGIQQVLSGCLVNECHKCPRNPELLHVSAVIACLPLSPYSLLLEDRAGSGTRKQTAGPPCNETPLCVEKHKLLIHTTNGWTSHTIFQG